MENIRMNTDLLLRPFWQRIFGQAWILNALLFILMGFLRAYGMLGPESARIFIMLGFLVMWFLPVVFLSKNGRRAIGLKKPERPAWLLWGTLIGAAAALLTFLIGFFLYRNSPDNWFVSVHDTYMVDPQLAQSSKAIVFLIYTIPAVIFSPVGEELFFRGMIHESVRQLWGNRLATAVNALAFGAIHILHHGLTMEAAGLHFLGLSGLLWVLLMMGLSWLFTICRQRGGSIWPAVLGHAAFNLIMNLTIFFILA
jgi:membrane protease YdiL (CAAX protease family)